MCWALETWDWMTRMSAPAAAAISAWSQADAGVVATAATAPADVIRVMSALISSGWMGVS